MAGVTVSKEGKSTLESDRKSDDEEEQESVRMTIKKISETFEFVWRRRKIETAGP